MTKCKVSIVQFLLWLINILYEIKMATYKFVLSVIDSSLLFKIFTRSFFFLSCVLKYSWPIVSTQSKHYFYYIVNMYLFT